MSPLVLNIIEFVGHHFISVGIFLFGFIAFLNIFIRWRRSVSAEKLHKKSLEAGVMPNLHPVIDTSLCAGCGSCVKACPEGKILQLINHKSTLVYPAKCVGHGACEKACARGAIKLVFGTKERGVDIPRIDANFETNIKGLYIAGELGGMGLISNAVKQGQLATKHAIKSLPHHATTKTDVDICIIGAGPAGFSSALTAVGAKKSYALIEQGSFGGTVANYPKQKMVTTIPLVLPIIGKVAFKKNQVTKEEILALWKNVARQTKLRIYEKTTFEDITVSNGIFTVKTSKKSITAKKVILAMGLRGSPRKLNIPNEDLPKVTYNLIDAAQYSQQAIVVVGAGNSAVEAAVALSKPELKNKVYLVVRKNELSRCTDKNKTEIMEQEKRALVKILYNSEIATIAEKYLEIKQEEKIIKVENNYLFILVGADLPFEFLKKIGVKVDTLYGEGLA